MHKINFVRSDSIVSRPDGCRVHLRIHETAHPQMHDSRFALLDKHGERVLHRRIFQLTENKRYIIGSLNPLLTAERKSIVFWQYIKTIYVRSESICC